MSKSNEMTNNKPCKTKKYFWDCIGKVKKSGRYILKHRVTCELGETTDLKEAKKLCGEVF